MEIALDTEVTLAKYPTQMLVACLATEGGTVIYDSKAAINEVLYNLDSNDSLVAHNGKFDLKVLGTDLRRLKCKIKDTLVWSWLLDENGQHGLKALAPRWLDRQLEDPIVVLAKDPVVYWRKKGQLIGYPEYFDEVVHYCIEDTRAALELAPKLYEALPLHLRDWYWKWEQTYLKSLCETEKLGVGINDEQRAKVESDLSWERTFLEDYIYGLAGYDFNIGSNPVLSKVLFNKQWEDKERGQVGVYKSCEHGKALGKCKIEECSGPRPKMGYIVVHRRGQGLQPKRKTPTGRPSTDESALKHHEGNELVDAILRYRELDKLLGTYLQAFPRFTHNGRLYGNFNGTGTRTGRLSSSKPNLQNIPTRGGHGQLIRSLFVPAEGMAFIVADYSAIEARLLAQFSQEPYLLEAFATGVDVHQAVAARLFDKPVERVTKEERTVSKNIQYALLYGAGIKKVAQMCYIGGQYMTVPQTRWFYNRYFELLPAVSEWRKQELALLRMKGYVELPSGRRRHLPEIYSNDKSIVSYAERQAINVMAQGTAADILKIATCTLYEEGIVPVLQVHDELVTEVPLDRADIMKEQIVKHMVAAGQPLGIEVPLEVDATIGKSWADK